MRERRADVAVAVVAGSGVEEETAAFRGRRIMEERIDVTEGSTRS